MLESYFSENCNYLFWEVYIVENTCTSSSISKVKTEDQYHPQVHRIFEASLNHIQLCLKEQTNRDQAMVQQLRALIALFCKTIWYHSLPISGGSQMFIILAARDLVPLSGLWESLCTLFCIHWHTQSHTPIMILKIFQFLNTFFMFLSFIFLKVIYFLFYVYQCFVSMYICTPCACMGQWKSEEDIRFPGSRMRDGCEPW